MKVGLGLGRVALRGLYPLLVSCTQSPWSPTALAITSAPWRTGSTALFRGSLVLSQVGRGLGAPGLRPAGFRASLGRLERPCSPPCAAPRHPPPPPCRRSAGSGSGERPPLQPPPDHWRAQSDAAGAQIGVGGEERTAGRATAARLLPELAVLQMNSCPLISHAHCCWALSFTYSQVGPVHLPESTLLSISCRRWGRGHFQASTTPTLIPTSSVVVLQD